MMRALMLCLGLMATAALAFFPADGAINPVARPGCTVEVRWVPRAPAQVTMVTAPEFGVSDAACERTLTAAMATALQMKALSDLESR